MKAIFLIRKGAAIDAFELREIEKPVLSSGEVLIKTECFGLNFADVMARRGLYGDAPGLPFIPGYEVVGEVVEISGDVDKSWIGKRVLAMTRFGGYAEYAKTTVMACAEIDAMNPGQAAALAIQYTTAYYMAYDAIRLHRGDIVLVHAGAGGVGTALIQLCKIQGCTVIAIAGSDDKLQYMLDQGADHVINYNKEDYLRVIPLITDGVKLAASFNPVSGVTFKMDMKLIGAGGKVVLFGGSERLGKRWGLLSSLNFVRKMGLVVPIKLVMTSKSVLGVNMLRIADQQPEILKRCMEHLITLVKTDQIKPQIGASFKHLDIAKAHDLLESRNSVGKVVVYWDRN